MVKINFICGGKTGDLLHNLMVIKTICESNNAKGVLYITNNRGYGGDNFHLDIKKTYDDLEPMIMSQDYIESFHILIDGENISNFINLNQWRWSKLFFKTNWVNLLCDNYQIEPPTEPWIKSNKIEGISDTILIHRSLQRHTHNFPWEKIINENRCKFITNINSIDEYDSFPFKDKVELLTCETFNEFVQSINSCKFFIGNMSTPLAISHCIGKPHLGELYSVDEVHYIGDEKYIKDYYYISSNGDNNLAGIDRFINL
jgi:hypothetical protein